VLPILIVAGCATSGSQGPVARVTVITLSGAGDTARAFDESRHPYLKVTVEDGEARIAAAARSSTEGKRVEAEAAKARGALQRAREAYQQLNFAEAVAIVNQAQASLAGVASLPAHFALLGELSFQRGLNHLAQKDKAAAREALATATFLGHGGAKSGQVPPEVERFCGEARTALASEPVGSLSVTSRPSGARIILDGKPVGVAPATVVGGPGLHHVRLERTGQRPKAVFQRVIAAKVEAVEIFLDDAPPELAAQQLEGGRGPDRLAHPGALSALFGRDRAVLSVGAPDGSGALAARLLWLGSERGGPAPACARKTPRELADCLAPVLYRLASGKDPSPAETKTPFYKSWWFWTIIGAAVVGGTTAGVVVGVKRARSGTSVDLVMK
jgi:hypothetical protein